MVPPDPLFTVLCIKLPCELDICLSTRILLAKFEGSEFVRFIGTSPRMKAKQRKLFLETLYFYAFMYVNVCFSWLLWGIVVVCMCFCFFGVISSWKISRLNTAKAIFISARNTHSISRWNWIWFLIELIYLANV